MVALLFVMLWGPPKFRERDVMSVVYGAIDFATAIEAAVWVLGGIAMLWMLCRRVVSKLKPKLPLFFPGSLRLFLIYGIFAGFSTLYSLYPPYTAYRAYQLIVAILFVSCLFAGRAGRIDARDALKVLYIYAGVNIILQMIMYVVDPSLVGSSFGSDYRVHGGALSDYGISAMLLGVFFLSNALSLRKMEQRALNWLLYAASWYFLLLSKTRTTMFSGIAIFATIVLLTNVFSIRSFLIVAIPTATLVFYDLGTVVRDTLLRDSEGIKTLSGRVLAWEIVADAFYKSPWIGYGYSVAARVILSPFRGVIGSTHNAFMESAIGVGIMGLVPLTLSLLFAWKECISVIGSFRNERGKYEHEYRLCVQFAAVLVSVTLMGLTSGGIGGNASGVVMMFLLVVGGVHSLVLDGRGKLKGNVEFRRMNLI